MNLQHIEYFVELSHTHNYVISAEHLHITQPSLTYAISQLEQELGVKLFEKRGRNNVLTQYGKIFLFHAEATLRTLDTGIRAVKDRAQGAVTIRLGFFSYLGNSYIPTLIKSFREEHPYDTINFTFETGNTRMLLEGLEDGRFDFIFCSPTHKNEFASTVVSKQGLVMALPKGHELAGKKRITAKQASRYPFISYTVGTYTRKAMNGWFEDAGVTPDIRFEALETPVVEGFISSGFGIGLMPRDEVLDSMEIDLIPETSPRLERDIKMLWNDHISRPQLHDDFLRYVEKNSKGDR